MKMTSGHLHKEVGCERNERDTDEVEPGVGGEDLILLVDVDDLLQRQAEADHHRLGLVGDGPLQRVVLVQEEAEQFPLVGSGRTP